MKLLLIYTLMNVFTNNTAETNIEISAQTVITAIAEDDFRFMESAFKQRLLNPNQLYNGKTLLIHAVLLDKAEMVNLLVSRGALLDIPGDEGLTPMEYARKIQAIHALAELIVIAA